MKTFYLILAAIILAARVDGQIKLGVQAGPTLTNAVRKWGESGTKVKQNTINKLGYIFGVVATVPVNSSLFFQPGLNFGKEGYKMDLFNASDTSNFYFMSDEKVNFLEVPLDLIYHISAKKGLFYFGAGPVIGHGLSGKYEDMSGSSGPGQHPSSTSSIIKFNRQQSWSDGVEHRKPVMLSANLLVGYQMRRGLFINIEYKYGLRNVGPAYGSLTYNSLGVQLGFQFNSRSKLF
ncbi:outer membrane beta-barrel protein [Ferruginibacter sp.]|uniref:outer membrane beta-barrel protein n=1 Tax=Ferruginibacter sp. TaxID=1940288 RepID=UPI00265B6D74|nr:outer membrane beta-barrel protein [Ferruginibacter sp.]